MMFLQCIVTAKRLSAVGNRVVVQHENVLEYREHRWSDCSKGTASPPLKNRLNTLHFAATSAPPAL